MNCTLSNEVAPFVRAEKTGAAECALACENNSSIKFVFSHEKITNQNGT